MIFIYAANGGEGECLGASQSHASTHRAAPGPLMYSEQLCVHDVGGVRTENGRLATRAWRAVQFGAPHDVSIT